MSKSSITSNKYSSRPRMVVMGEVYNGNSSILTQPTEKRGVRRKLLYQALNPKALRLYKFTQEAEASRLCYALIQNPAGWEKQLERFTSSVVFCVAYGHRIDSLEAQTFPLIAKVASALAPWKREVQAMGLEEGQANLALLEMVKQEVATAKAKGKPDTVSDDLCKLLLDMREKESVPLSGTHFSYVPASLFGAGSDTTASTLCSASLGLVTHPGVLKVTQVELDSVVGTERTRTFADEANLPYIRVLCKETLRWRPVAALGGTPHASTEADIYEGWHIPSDTIVLGNNWAINFNEEYYPKPRQFDKVRFLSDAERARLGIDKQPYVGSNIHPAKAGHSSFGLGRRICPGADLAANSLFIALAKLLWAYDILPIEGRQYDIFAYTDGFNVRPKRSNALFNFKASSIRKYWRPSRRALWHGWRSSRQLGSR
ncbi:hypothetical protein LTR62_001965 [Meristemomyces frigidus]|uniref:Cytochrome P450 n=1 Tax=Meristemomyces frigidus TaxID=1508187 RepID=A0AAN7T8V9_9PEZI|nr:hypothetical protein LTR62_001965 [Meristemomyces frigidus]